MNKLVVLSLFDGISGAKLALNLSGINHLYYASEIDKHAIKVSRSKNEEIIYVGDVKHLTIKDLPPIDLLIGGSPCQDLSALKKDGLGLEGEKSGLFFEFVRLKNELNPKWFLLENVKNKWKFEMSKHLQSDFYEINSDRFVQQNRPRLYWTNIPVKPLPKRPDWKGRYFQYRRSYWRENKSGVCPCLTANMGTGGNNVPYKLDENDNLVKLTTNEVGLLQGLPNEYTSVKGVSKTQQYKMIGNGFTIPSVSHILSSIKS